MQTWLSVVGIGEDGLEGLTPVGRSLLAQARVIVGGARHLAWLPPDDSRDQLLWSSPIHDSVQKIIQRRGQPVCVLASGDPMCYGIGVTLTRAVPRGEITIVPAPSAFSLACARLGWPLAEVDTLSLCGRDLALLNAVLYPGAQVLVLSADRTTPPLVAQRLREQGYGDSQITVLERLGGPQERITTGTAATWSVPDLADLAGLADLADLNTLALQLSAAPQAPWISARTPGLPDSAYRHDGQLTKQEVRALTLAALAPVPGQLLWDVGAGCGSIGIEWLRSDRRCRAIAIEQHPDRLQLLAHNASALGVPQLRIVEGYAPQALQDLPAPDAIFIGGGLTCPELLDTCWRSLRWGGRLVANAVTVETEQLLFQGQSQWGGSLTRIAIQRAQPLGKFLGWKAMAPVTQWIAVKTPGAVLGPEARPEPSGEPSGEKM